MAEGVESDRSEPAAQAMTAASIEATRIGHLDEFGCSTGRA